MSLLFDVLKKQAPVSDIPETELPDEADLADVQANLPPVRADSEVAESIALQLDKSVAGKPAVDLPDIEDTTIRPTAETLELAPEATSDDPDRVVFDETRHDHLAAAPTPDHPVLPAFESAVAIDRQSDPPTMWRRRPAVEWALIALFVVAILIVTMVFFIEPESGIASVPTEFVESRPEPVAMTAPEVTENQSTDEPVATPISIQSADLTGGDKRANDRRPQDRQVDESSDARLSRSGNEQANHSAAGIRVSPTRAGNPVFAALSLAYAAYQRGDDATALTHYRIAAELDATNRNALLGLAAIAQRRGDLPEARRFYQRLLDLNPKDSVVVSALLAMRDERNVINDESWLKSMLRDEPRAAHLHFGLGLRYVAQERWPDAQGSFFEAVRYAPDNSDYNFNLAVTLDRLGKQRSAANYYRRAIEYATGAQSFDVDAAKTRLATISRRTDG